MTRPLRALAIGLAVALPIATLAEAQPNPRAIGLTEAEAQEAKKLHDEARRLLDAGRIRELVPVTERLLALRAEEIRRVDQARDQLTQAGKVIAAIPVAERLLALRESLLGPEHADVLVTAHYLAVLHRRAGDYRRAEPLFRRVLAAREARDKAHKEERTDTLVALASLAQLYHEQQDYERAEPLFLRLLERRGPDDIDAITSLGRLYDEMGDSARAEPLFLRALALSEKLKNYSFSTDPGYVEPEHPQIGVALNILANVYRERGDHARAEPLFARALAIAEKTNGPDHRSVAMVLNNQALLYRAAGDRARARALFSRSLTIREKSKNPGDLSVLLFNLGHLERDDGDLAAALRAYARSLELLEQSVGPQHPRVADVLASMAKVELAQGATRAAVSLQARAEAIRDDHADRLLAIGSEAQKRKYMATLDQSTNGAVSLHASTAPASVEAARLAFTTILRRKGRVLDAMTDSLQALRGRLEAGDQALLDELSALTAQLAALVSRGRGSLDAAEHRESLGRLDREIRRVEADMSARSAEFRAARRPVTIAEVQSAIPEGAALLEIFVYSPLDASATPGDVWGEPRYVAYVLPRRGEIAWADLGEAARIDAAVDELRALLADPVRDAKPAARALDAAVLAPVAALIGDARHVLLSPDGALNLVPFGALRDEQGRYRIERTSFTYLTSGRDLLRLSASTAPRQGALILAAPAFGPIDAPTSTGGSRGVRSVDMAKVRFPPLPGTEQEGRTIGDEMGTGARVLLGADATEAAIKAARGPRLLHAATHGFFLPGDRPAGAPLDRRSPAAAGLIDYGREGLDPREGAEALRVDSPLLRAGLAFTGANARESGADDGVLTALEALSLDLHGTHLIVLSACETGVGEAVRGDGVYGLRRALVIAGAETQVMSLWRVQDEATRDLMVAYYRKLRAGGGRSESMREVQLAMLAHPETAAPYFWAPFIVSGNGAPLDSAPAAPAAPAKVPPGPRGCGCEQPGQRPSQGGAGVILLFAGLLTLAGRVTRGARRG